jgi:hypothetical protein
MILLRSLFSWGAAVGALRARLWRRCRAEAGELRASLRAAPREPATWLALAGLTALALALRLPWLNEPIRYDESFTYNAYVSRPLYVVVAKYDYPNNHVLHSVCAHLACRCLGGDPWALRLPALLAGALLPAAAYLAGRVLYGRAAGLLGGCLVAASSILIEYSTNARGYTLLGVLALLQVALGGLLLRRRSLLGWAAWAGVAALGFWTVPTMLYACFAVVVWMALCRAAGGAADYRGPFLLDLASACALAGALTVLLYSPVLLVSGGSGLFGNRYVASLDWSTWGERFTVSLTSTWAQWQRDLPGPLVAVVALSFTAATLLHRRLGRQPVPLAPVVLVCGVGLCAAQRVAPFERVWLFALPLYLTTAAAGIVAALRALPAPARWQPALLGTAAAVLVAVPAGQMAASGSVQQSRETGTFRDAAEVARLLRDRLGPEDRVVAACPSNAPLLYHFARQGMPSRHLAEPQETLCAPRLFVVVNTHHGQTFDALAQRFRLGQVADLAAARLVGRFESGEVYEVPGASPPPPEPLME